MTLPFRRRHHDDESGHDRARALWSTAMLEPLEAADEAWLQAHLAGCGECRLEHEDYLADRQLLRGLRAKQPEPPRDLWARTAAAIDREAARRRGRTSAPVADRLVPRQFRLPLGVASGLLVAVVVVAVSLLPRGLLPTTGQGAGSDVAVATAPGPSPLSVAAAPVAWIETAADGRYELKVSNIDKVCPDEKTGCAPLGDRTQSVLTLGERPQALVGSPANDELVIVVGRGGSQSGSVVVVPVPEPGSTPTQAPTGPPSTTPSGEPGSSPSGSSEPTPIPTPEGAHSIAEGVAVVGETRYSPGGKWLAFSAAPIDGSTGPDLYVWNGVDARAVRVTSDHATYFSSWFGDTILASHLSHATPSTGPSGAPASSAGAGPITFVDHATSFLFDPASGVTTDLTTPDVWMPVVDRTGRFMTYWLGTLATGPGVAGVQLASGHVVLDGWLEPLGHGAPGASDATGTPRTVGPAGTPVELVAGPISAFDARFDPNGTRLAVWVADAADPTVGTLRLVALDHGNGDVNVRVDPLPSVAALKGFSIDEGRLAWVTPPGQDGNQSSVQVLAWSDDDFGQVQTVPGQQLTIIR